MNTKIKYGIKNLESDIGEMTFGRMLKNFREMEGVSQKIFAVKLSISPQRLNDFEKGRRLPDISTSVAFAKKLKDSESFFIQILFQDYLRLESLKYEVKLKKIA